MHGAQKQWCESIKEQFPEYFSYAYVVDVGSLNVNGTNRYLFTDCSYVGIDVIPGDGVDFVQPFHELEVDLDPTDVILSTNALEHDMFWFLTLPKMIRTLRRGGLMFFSCAYSQRTHGTTYVKPRDSGTTQLKGDWKKYYRNIKVMDIYSVMNPERSFGAFMMGTSGRDLRFWGIKR